MCFDYITLEWKVIDMAEKVTKQVTSVDFLSHSNLLALGCMISLLFHRIFFHFERTFKVWMELFACGMLLPGKCRGSSRGATGRRSRRSSLTMCAFSSLFFF